MKSHSFTSSLSRLLTASTILAWMAWPQLADAEGYGEPRRLGTLDDSRVSESSGLAISPGRDGVFWTHNDSGDQPRLFSFDLEGVPVGDCLVDGADSIDWEDMASFARGERPYLLIADVGDNARRRKSCTLYLVAEPEGGQRIAATRVKVKFRYEDGPRDCEAVGVDPTTGTAYLVAKQLSLTCPVYAVDIPERTARSVSVARRVADLAVPVVTAMDISPDGRRAIVLTYGHAYEYSRANGESWPQAFARDPTEVRMPPRRQGESICYGGDSRTLYLTSEHLPTPIWEVPYLDSTDIESSPEK